MVIFHSYVKLPEGKHHEKSFQPGEFLLLDQHAAGGNVGRRLEHRDSCGVAGDPEVDVGSWGAERGKTWGFGYSLDWFKGKFTGNHGFYHRI